MRTLTTQGGRARIRTGWVVWFLAGALAAAAAASAGIGTARLSSHSDDAAAPVPLPLPLPVPLPAATPAATPVATGPDVPASSAARSSVGTDGPTYYLVGSVEEARRVRETGDETRPYKVLIVSSPEEAEGVMHDIDNANQLRLALGEPPLTVVDLRGE